MPVPRSARRRPRCSTAPSLRSASALYAEHLLELRDDLHDFFTVLEHVTFVAQARDASVSELAAFLGVTLPTASAMVDRLLKAELVAARVSARDRRRTELEATARGVALMEQVRRGAQRELAQRLGPLTGDELACVTQALTLLQRSFPHA